jgi:hypothetical protein
VPLAAARQADHDVFDLPLLGGVDDAPRRLPAQVDDRPAHRAELVRRERHRRDLALHLHAAVPQLPRHGRQPIVGDIGCGARQQVKLRHHMPRRDHDPHQQATDDDDDPDDQDDLRGRHSRRGMSNPGVAEPHAHVVHEQAHQHDHHDTDRGDNPRDHRPEHGYITADTGSGRRG